MSAEMVLRSSIIFERLDFSFEIKGKRLGIQLPDGLKYYASEIAEFFEKKGFEVILSGKASYGACDIDLDLLKMVDVLLHVGHTKLLNYKNVIYVPYKVDYEVDPQTIKKNLKERRIALIGTANYAWKFKEVAKVLESVGYVVELRRGVKMEFDGQILGCNYSCLKDIESDAILFIGDGTFHAVGAAIYAKKRVYAYNPLTNEMSIIGFEDFLKKRYFAISKAKLCNSFGILVSKKPGQKRLRLALKLKKMAEEKGIRAEIILADEITSDLIENLNFCCYINTACPRVTYDDYKKFSKTIISPQEFEIALGFREDYELDII